jgi:predicted ATPase
LGWQDFEGFAEYVARHGGAEAFLRLGSQATSEIQTTVHLATESRTGVLSLTLPYRPPDSLGYYFTFKADPVTGQKRAISVEDLTVGVYHFHDTSLNGPARKSAFIGDNQRLHGDAGNLAAILYVYQEFHKRQIEKLPERRVRGTPFQRIESTIRKLFPSFDRFVLEPERLDPNRIILKWKQPGSDYLFGPHQLSDGTLRAMALTTLLLQPEEDLPGVLVIDEPELGLHPSAIELVAGMVRAVSHHCQVVLATQSPTLLDHFDPEEIVVMDIENGASRFRRLSAKELAHWLKDYTIGQLWQKNVIGGGPLP